MGIKKLKWEFASTGGGHEDGISNPMIEHFSSDLNYHLAREVIQNSIDARLNSEHPVRVKFELFHFPAEGLPGGTQLREIISSCGQYWKGDNKTQTFINKALETFRSDQINVLKISDYNTKGLSGDDENIKGPWYNLVKSRGASSKSAGEGGSFGIGKGAPFAASNVRTVFYSSYSHEDLKHKFIGLAELVSFKLDGDTKRGAGSYGFEGQKTVFKPHEFPDQSWVREETGLDIYVMGYKVLDNWQETMIKSVLRNFWYAIDQNELAVEVDGREINRNNLESSMSEFFFNEPAKDSIKPEGNPLHFYQAVKSSTPIEEKLPLLGNVKFFFKQTDIHLNRVALLRRSHMVIYTKRFVFPSPFAGVFVCDDPAGNEELRQMEPPAHDDWDPHRNEENGDKVLKELIQFIRQILNDKKQIKKSGALRIPGLSKYLPFEDSDNLIEDNSNGESQFSGESGEEETARKIQEKDIFEPNISVETGEVTVINPSGGGNETKPRKGKRKKRPGGGGGGDPLSPGTLLQNLEIRSFLINQNGDLYTYRILLTSLQDRLVKIRVRAAGEDSDEDIKLLKAETADGTILPVSGSIISGLKLFKDKKQSIQVQMRSALKCAIKISAHAINK